MIGSGYENDWFFQFVPVGKKPYYAPALKEKSFIWVVDFPEVVLKAIISFFRGGQSTARFFLPIYNLLNSHNPLTDSLQFLASISLAGLQQSTTSFLQTGFRIHLQQLWLRRISTQTKKNWQSVCKVLQRYSHWQNGFPIPLIPHLKRTTYTASRNNEQKMAN